MAIHQMHIGAFDANNNQPASSSHGSRSAHGSGRSPQQQQTMSSNTSRAEAGGAPPSSDFYADDDSVVSSNVTMDEDDRREPHQPQQHYLTVNQTNTTQSAVEPAILTQEVEADIENATMSEPEESKAGMMLVPRDRREWTFCFLACLCILCVALAIGLGLGLGNKDEESDARVTRPWGSGGGNRDIPGVGTIGDGSGGSYNVNGNPSGNHNGTTPWPSYSPTMDPSGDSGFSGPNPKPLDGVQAGIMAGAVQYHLISQEVSDIASFEEMASETEGATLTPQQRAVQRARDWLVLKDTLPLAMKDEIDARQGDVGYDGGDDDPLAIQSSRPNQNPGRPGGRPNQSQGRPNQNNQQRTRPYLETSTPAYRVVQRFSAAVLYFATEGDKWESSDRWLAPGVHECEWIGISCQSTLIPAITLEESLENADEIPRHDDGTVDRTVERMITAIDLPENGMTGYLPREVAALPYLERLGLWSNQIGGALPSQLSRLSRLSSLHLDDNALTGRIPSELGELSELTTLQLGWNREVRGPIPSELGNLFKLERLRLSNMNLRGPIPPALGNLRKLKAVYLQDNRLNGRLPEELENLVNLETLDLSENEFTGNIPLSWARGLVKLKRLEIQGNRMEFAVDYRMCALRANNAPQGVGGGGLLEALVADCEGDEPKVSCNCCECLP